jgi:hypothetical protein
MYDHFNNSFISTITTIIIYINNFYFNIFSRCYLFLLPVCAFLLWIIFECILLTFSLLSPYLTIRLLFYHIKINIIIIIIVIIIIAAEKQSMLSCHETGMQKKLQHKADNKTF